MNIPSIDARILFDQSHELHTDALGSVKTAVTDIGFMTIHNTEIDSQTIIDLIDTYKAFFLLPDDVKSKVDMATTGSNRGWGGTSAEQVSQDANPDYKQVFDCGTELEPNDPLSHLTYYAPNQWPDTPADFAQKVQSYYVQSTKVALKLLSAVAVAINEPADHFAEAFDKPMALLRGNYYPSRPSDATDKDFGIAPHTDYGCLTLLATDGTPGLEVQVRDGTWQPICVPPGEFVINFGEMLEFWSVGQVVATPHRVVGSNNERVSIPLFFNPRYNTDISPKNADGPILAGDHLSRRYDETYVHRQKNRA